MTTAQLKAQFNTEIRQQTDPESITPDIVADQLDSIADEMQGAIQILTDGATITMNVANGKWGQVTIAGNRTVSFSNLTSGDAGFIYVRQDGVGGRLLNWPGNAVLPQGGLSLSSGPNELTIIGYVYNGSNIHLTKENYGTAVLPGDTTPPAVSSVTAISANQLQYIYNETATMTLAGHSFKKNGSAWTAASISGSGTTWVVTMASNAIAGDTLLTSYDSGTGATVDAAVPSNELVSYTDRSIINSIGLTQLAKPTGQSATTISSTQINLACNTVVNAVNYIWERSLNGSTGWAQISTSTGVSYSDTGRNASTTYYYRVKVSASGFADSVYSDVTSATTSASSGTWTARGGISMAGNTNGYWEWLPAGYNSSTPKPVFIFLHGAGEGGNGTSQLNNALTWGLPKLISQSGFPEDAIVICPQFTQQPYYVNIDGIINYIIANYAVNTAKVYLTGYSMGGGQCTEYAKIGDTTKLTAIVPIAGNNTYVSADADVFVADNMPMRFIHDSGDGTVLIGISQDWVNGLNSKGINPAASLLTTTGFGHQLADQVMAYNYNFSGGQSIYQWCLAKTRSLYDADAQTFIDNASIADAPTRTIINNLVLAAKGGSNPWWNKLVYGGINVGGSAAQRAVDLKTGMSKVTWTAPAGTASQIHTAAGTENIVRTPPSTADGYGIIDVNMNSMPDHSYGLHMYRTDNADHGNQYVMGWSDNGADSYFILQMRNSGTHKGYMGSASEPATNAGTDSRGFFSVVLNGTTLKLYRNGSQIGSTVTLAANKTKLNQLCGLFCRNEAGGTVQQISPAISAGQFITEGMTDAEVAQMYTNVHAFNTALSRSV